MVARYRNILRYRYQGTYLPTVLTRIFGEKCHAYMFGTSSIEYAHLHIPRKTYLLFYTQKSASVLKLGTVGTVNPDLKFKNQSMKYSSTGNQRLFHHRVSAPVPEVDRGAAERARKKSATAFSARGRRLRSEAARGSTSSLPL